MRPLKYEVTGPFVSAVRKQKETNACAQCTFPFYIQSRVTAQGMMTPTFRVGLPTSANLIYIIHNTIAMPRDLFPC